MQGVLLAFVVSAAVGAPLLASQGGAGDPRGARPSNPQARVPGPGHWEWWKDAEVQKQLALSPDKVKRIDGIYRSRSSNLQPTVDQYMRELATLDAMTRAASADEASYNLQVVQVEALRSEISRSRTVMLYRFFRELQPEQYAKLQDIFAQRAARMMRDRGNPGRQ